MMRSGWLCWGLLIGAMAGCDAGVDFDADVAGLLFGRAGGALTSVFQVTVDFTEPGLVAMLATQTNDGTLVKSATASCDLGPAEQGLFETRVPGTDCVFESTLADDELPPTPETIVIGLKNRTDDDVLLDPSLDEPLPSPFSLIDGYNTLTVVPAS